MEPRRRRYGSRRCRCSPQDCADGCSSKRVNEGLCVAGFRCRWCGGENSSREQHLVKDAYTLSLTYVGVVAHVRGRTAALVCRIPSLLPNGAGCSVVATSVFACPDYWGCGATFTLSCVVGGLAGRSQEDCVISHMTDIYRGVCGRYRKTRYDIASFPDRYTVLARRGRSLRCPRWLWRRASLDSEITHELRSHRHLYELLNSKITKDLVTQTQDHTAPLNSKLKILN